MAMFSQRPKRLILVTGMPRSGTTPVGERLTKLAGCGELYEPLNPDVGDVAVDDWFLVPGGTRLSLTDANDLLDRVMLSRLRFRWPSKQSGRLPLLNRTHRTITAEYLCPSSRAVVWKDPFAFFFIPLAVQRRWPVIVTVRDHLSALGSFQRMNWIYQPAPLIEQLKGANLRLRYDCFDKSSGSIAQNAAILWNILAHATLEMLERGLPILVVDSALNINDPDEMRRRLSKVTGMEVPIVKYAFNDRQDNHLPQTAHVKERSRQSMTELWKEILTKEDIEFSNTLNGELWHTLQEAILNFQAKEDQDIGGFWFTS